MQPTKDKPSLAACSSSSNPKKNESSSSAAGKKRPFESKCKIKLQNGSATCSTLVPFKPHPVPKNYVIPKKGRGKDIAVLEKVYKRSFSTVSVSSDSCSDSDEESEIIEMKNLIKNRFKTERVCKSFDE